MSSLPPNVPPAPPPGVPPQPPSWYGGAPPREGRGTAFFVAIFLGILLLVSGALNVLLIVLTVGSFATAGLTGGLAGDDDGGTYEVVHVAGSRDATNKVLRLPIHGAIAEGQNPILGAAGGTVSQVRRALRLLKDKSIRGLWLDIDSPGGGVTDSDEIYQMLVKARAERPDVRVLAVFGDVAASGGYYVAAAAERIMAHRTSLTGSIGVIMSAWNFAEAAKKFGVEQIAIKSEHTPLKDILSPTRPMTAEERALLTGIVDEYYQQFVSVVDAGRPNLDRQQVLALATGAIYTAGQAQQNGLIDLVGTDDDALAWFATELHADVGVVEQRRRPGLRDLLLGARAPVPAVSGQAALERLLVGGSGPRFLFWWPGGR